MMWIERPVVVYNAFGGGFQSDRTVREGWSRLLKVWKHEFDNEFESKSLTAKFKNKSTSESKLNKKINTGAQGRPRENQVTSCGGHSNRDRNEATSRFSHTK